MPQQSVILHERLGRWSRQLRPRFQGWPIRWSETRSTRSLHRAASLSSCPILLIELDARPSRGLEDLATTLDLAPGLLSVVIDYNDRMETAAIAREIGATLVLSGVVVPPALESLLKRWLPLSAEREQMAGWSSPIDPEPEPLDRPEPFLKPSPYHGHRADAPDPFPPTKPNEDFV